MGMMKELCAQPVTLTFGTLLQLVARAHECGRDGLKLADGISHLAVADECDPDDTDALAQLADWLNEANS